MESFKLGEFATFKSGLVLSRKTSKESTGQKYNILTLKSVSSESYIDFQSTETMFMNEHLKSEYLTHCGDIVIRLSSPYTAVLIDNATEGLVISSNFIVVRGINKVDTNYLHRLLNTDELKSHITRNSSGGILGSIKSSFYTDLDIELPTIENQQQIGTLYQLSRRETQLLEQLIAQKKIHHKCIINQIQKNARKGNI